MLEPPSVCHSTHGRLAFKEVVSLVYAIFFHLEDGDMNKSCKSHLKEWYIISKYPRLVMMPLENHFFSFFFKIE